MMLADHEERPPLRQGYAGQARPPQRPRDDRPAPAAGQKSAEDLRAILRRMTEEANKGKSIKVAEKQNEIRQSVAQATQSKPTPPPIQNQAPKPPQSQPQPQPAPAAPQAPQAQVPQAPKPFEVPESDLRNLFNEKL